MEPLDLSVAIICSISNMLLILLLNGSYRIFLYTWWSCNGDIINSISL